MQMQLTDMIDKKLHGALSRMASDDARTPALQLLWLARAEAQRRGLLERNAEVREEVPHGGTRA